MPIDREEVYTLTHPYREPICECVVAGVDDYNALKRYMPHAVKKRTSANLINDFIESHVRNKLDGVQGVKLGEFGGLFYAVIQEKLAIRFKKLSAGKKTSNVITQQSQAFLNQQLILPGSLAQVNLFVGYELDSLHSKLESITLTCPIGSRNAFFFKIDEDEDINADTVDIPILEFSLPKPPSPDLPLRARKDEVKERRERKGNV